MCIVSSLVLWNKMLITKLHIFLSSEKYLIIIRTPFPKWLWTLVKMEKRRLVLSCRKGRSRDWGDGRGRGCQEISLRFMFVFLVNRLCYSCYSPNIPSNNSKVRNQDDWLCWLSVICLTKKNEYGTKKGEWENDTPLQTMLVCNLVFAIRWDKLFPFDSFFNEIQLTEKPFSEVFIKFLSTL